MNIQVFPNRFKKLGVGIFIAGIIGLILSFYYPLLSVFQAETSKEAGTKMGIIVVKMLTKFIKYEWRDGDAVSTVAGFLILGGMIIYLMAKEKIEDEYIENIRLRSYQLSLFIISVLFVLMFLGGITISALFTLYLFFGIYLLVFTYKKE